MVFGRIVVAAFVAALMMSGTAEAQSAACRNKCNKGFQSCGKMRQTGGDACLKKWHACKKTCQAPVASVAKPRQTAVPAPRR